MREHVILPCECGKLHRFKNPEENHEFRCQTTNAELFYECQSGRNYRLRGKAEQYILEGDEIMLGRQATNTVVISDPLLSRVHCRFHAVPGGYEIEDLKSGNGTFLNEERLPPYKRILLEPGDLLRLGETFLRYIIPETTESTTVRKAVRKESTVVMPMPVTGQAGPLAGDSLIGKQLGDYKIKSFLAQGGMGRVYIAEQVSLWRACVVKVIVPEERESEETTKRFMQEVRVGANAAHPNIVVFYGVGEQDGMLYMAMEYFPGKDLYRRFCDSPAPYDLALNVCRQVAEALACTHKQGIVHRDIKPNNILMNDEGFVKIIDFGLSKVRQDPRYTRITASSGIVGSPAFMAPEQINNPRNINHLADVYAMGVVLFFLVTGQPPFSGEKPIEVLYEVTQGIPSPRTFRPDLPKDIEAVIMKAAALRPEGRYQSADEFLKALGGIQV